MTVSRFVPYLALTLSFGCQSATPPATSNVKGPEPQGPPRLEVKERHFDAGDLDNTKRYDHTFTVANAGGEPLRLTVLRKSCSCGSVEVPADGIAPGGTGPVVFRWSPPVGTVGPYHLRADFETNDPQEPFVTLEVTGRADPRVRLSPPNLPYLDFDNLQPGRPTERSVRVFSTKLDDFKLRIKAVPPGLQAATEPLTRGEAVDDVKVNSGYRLILKTTDKLPAGSFRDELSFEVTLPGEAEPKLLKLPIYVTVNNGVCAVTPSKINFTCTRIAEGDSKNVRVQFFLPSDKDRVEIVHVEPALLTTSPPKELARGTWQFAVTLPKDNAEAAKLQADGFEGKVVFRTGEGSPEVSVRVNWDPPAPK
jgi:hypothetical protein